MAYTPKRAETIVTSLEFQINPHPLKLPAAPLPEQHGHWRREVTAWLPAIAAIRLKPSTRPAPARFYCDFLFDEPFGGNGAEGVVARSQLPRQQYGRLDPAAEPAALAGRLKTFAAGRGEGAVDVRRISALVYGLLWKYLVGPQSVTRPRSIMASR